MSKLTAEVFARGVGILSSRWNRDISPELSAVYAQWLAAARCTAEEFIAGATRAVAELEFFPSAKQILELGRPELDPSTAAGEVFVAVLKLRKYIVPHGMRLALDDVEAELGSTACRALVSIGGPSRVIGLSDESFPFVLREFTRAYVAFDAEAQSRAAAGRILEAGRSNGGALEGQRLDPARRIRSGPSPIGDTATALVKQLTTGDSKP
jgi:hypothetical protein